MVLESLPSGNNAFMKSFLKIGMKNELEYKTYKKPFESIKKRSKKLDFF